MQNYIPDSIDALALNGIVNYDAKAFIYDRKSELPIQKTPEKVDTFEKKSNDKKWKTFGNVVLGALGLTALGIVFKKKIPQLGKDLMANVQKLFKKH